LTHTCMATDNTLMTLQRRDQRGAMTLMLAASAAVLICTGSETLAAERLMGRSGSSFRGPSRPGAHPLTAWLSQVTHEVATGWRPAEQDAWGLVGVPNFRIAVPESEGRCFGTPAVVDGPPNQIRMPGPCEIDLPPPQR